MATTVVNGVTFITTSGSVTFSDMAAVYGNATRSLSAMRGKKWYRPDFTRGTFTSFGGISLSELRNTSGNIPHVNRAAYPGTGLFFGSGPIAIPRFNTLKIQVYSAGGGGGGGNSSYIGGFNNGQTIYGNAGGAGGSTSMTIATGTLSSGGGGGGNQGSPGSAGTPATNAASPPGGSGNGNGGAGGYVEYNINADTDYGGAFSLWDKSYTPTYGAGGGGGSGAAGLSWISTGGGGQGYYTFNGINGSNGNPGTAGGVSIFVDYGLY